MRRCNRFLTAFFCLLISVLCVEACSKEKAPGKVMITESEFVLRQDGPHAYVMDAKGKVKNVGQVNVKNIVITGYCRSCGELINPGNWFISDVPKTRDQKAYIPYLAVGEESDFAFKEVAFIYNTVPEKPKQIPERLEAVVVSFEAMD